MNALAFPNELVEFLNAFMVGGVALLTLARSLVVIVDKVLNRFGYDVPDESIGGYAIVTAVAILLVASVGEVLGMTSLIGFTGIVWKILAGIIGGLAARAVT